MNDRLQMGTPSQYVTSHPGQLTLAIPPWVGANGTISISDALAMYPWSGSVNWYLADG